MNEIIFSLFNILSVLFVGILAFIGSLLGYQLNQKIFKTNRRDAFTMAALDKKLEAHQQAFEHSWDFPELAQPSESRVDDFNEVLEWYKKNCVYLEPKTRAEFLNTLWATQYYDAKLKLQEKGELTVEELVSEWNKFFQIRQTILDGVSEPILIQFPDKGEPVIKNKVKKEA